MLILLVLLIAITGYIVDCEYGLRLPTANKSMIHFPHMSIVSPFHTYFNYMFASM